MAGREGIGSVYLLAGLLAAVALPASAEEWTLYLAAPSALVSAVPSRSVPRENANVTVRQGRNAALVDFGSKGSELPALTWAEAELYLVTGKEGMPRCADVNVSVLRVGPGGHRTLLGSDAVATTLLPRRGSTVPVVVPLMLDDPGIDGGGDIALEVVIGNRCGGLRQVSLLYDGVAHASRLRVGSGTSTTTPTTVPSEPATTTTTTTLPPAEGCTAYADGFTALECHLGELARIFSSTPATAFGNEQRRAHLEARRTAAAAKLARARGGRRVATNLNVVNRRLAAIRRVVDRSVARGKIAAPVGFEILSIVGQASSQLGAMRASLD